MGNKRDQGSPKELTISKVVSIEPIGELGVWDIEVEDDHSYLAHGFVNHNSCEWPNLQQMPRNSVIKSMFISRWRKLGGVLLQADYSQAELRVLATLCDETNMIEAFNRGDDIHLYVASLVFGMPPEEISKELRSIAKAASFGIMYGQGPKALAYAFGTTQEEAQGIIDTLFGMFPNLRGWMDEKIQEAKDHGLVTTPMGRIRWIQDANSRERGKAGAAARKAVNSPIQSAASDWTLCSLNEVVRQMAMKGFKSLPVATIHDSIMVDVYPGELLNVIDLMRYEMVERLPERFPWIGVTPAADFEFGVNWQKMTDIFKDEDGCYKIKGSYGNIKENLWQLTMGDGYIEQLDSSFDLDNPSNSWVLVDMDEV